MPNSHCLFLWVHLLLGIYCYNSIDIFVSFKQISLWLDNRVKLVKLNVEMKGYTMFVFKFKNILFKQTLRRPFISTFSFVTFYCRLEPFYEMITLEGELLCGFSSFWSLRRNVVVSVFKSLRVQFSVLKLTIYSSTLSLLKFQAIINDNKWRSSCGV